MVDMVIKKMNNTAALIANYPQEVRDMTYKARALIISVLPKITEMPDEKAGVIGYGYSNKYIDQVCTIILSKKGIKIGLNRGAELNDPEGLLAGSGKVHKYFQIHQIHDLEHPGLQTLLLQGWQAWKKRTTL
jgi:hypothetical protein